MPIPIRLGKDLRKLVRDAARQTRLKESDVIRQSLRLGVPQLVLRLQVAIAPMDYPPGSVRHLYTKQRNREELVLSKGSTLEVERD